MFNYKEYLSELNRLKKTKAFVSSIGQSVLGQDIPYISVQGSAASELSKTVIISGGIHAREYITVFLTLFLANSALQSSFKSSFVFIPCVNPDGFRLATEGVEFLNEKREWHRFKRYLQAIPETDYRLWKANIKGVDLNVNFDAEWGNGKLNVFSPSSENYIGEKPLDQPETLALSCFTQTVKPALTVSYHCKGEVIYWMFKQNGRRLWRDYTFAKRISEATGYKLKDRDGSVGGYKDWCVQKLKIPSITVEVGKDSLQHPLTEECLPDIIQKNKSLLYEIDKYLYPKKTEKS